MAPRKKPQAEKPAAKVVTPDAKAKPTAPASPAKPKVVKPKVKKFVAVHSFLYHPFANVVIPTGPPGVILEEPDSWLECQITRGLVKEL